MTTIQARCYCCGGAAEWDTEMGQRAVCVRCWDHGAAGHFSSAEIAERNKRIRLAKEAGMSNEDIGGREGMRTETVRRVLARAARR